MARHKNASKMFPEFQPPMAFGQDGFRSAAKAYQSWLEGLSACNAEATRFIGKRLAKDFDIPHQLASCQTPTDVLEVHSSFVRTMISDYSDEAQRMSELATEAFANGIDSADESGARKGS